MATKVKGDAIKEGSIPLSALSNEVKDKIENAGGGADWNAKEGEAGYIENKPFEYGYSYKEDINTEFRSTDNTQSFFIFSEEDVYKNFTLRYNGELYYNDVGTGDTYKIGDISGSILINKLNETIGDSNFRVSCYYDDSELGYFIMVTYEKGNNDSTYEVRNANIEIIVDEKIVKIDDKYLSDTVLKTTPQTLSDADKNQALANLGIPRVLNIDSHGIEDNLTIDELSEILGDCVTNEILIQGLCHKTKYETVYLPTLHQSYTDFDGRKILNKLVCGQYRVDEDTYDVHLVVAPSIYLHYDEETQRYRSILEEY